MAHARLLARVEGGDRDVLVEPREHLVGVRREREAPLGRQVEAPGMAVRDRTTQARMPGQSTTAARGDRLAPHTTPRQARAPSARSARKRKSAAKARK